jgi:hypothetical protein
MFMKSFKHKIVISLGVFALAIVGSYMVFAQSGGATLPSSDYDLFGYACNFVPEAPDLAPIGCISLNKLSSAGQPGFGSQPTSPWSVTYNPATGAFGGTGWNPVVGEIKFGMTCPSGVSDVIPGAQYGQKCAKITSIAGDAGTSDLALWKGYIYTGSVTYIPPSSGTPTGLMSGVAWGANNIDGATAPYNPDVGVGRVDFSQFAYIQIPGCMDPSKTNYEKYATVQDNSCTSTIEICTNVIDDNNNGTINEGCPEICNDGLDNNQNNQIDENCTVNSDPCTDGIDNDNDGAIDSADPSECSGIGNGGGTGSGSIKPRYRER